MVARAPSPALAPTIPTHRLWGSRDGRAGLRWGVVRAARGAAAGRMGSLVRRGRGGGRRRQRRRGVGRRRGSRVGRTGGGGRRGRARRGGGLRRAWRRGGRGGCRRRRAVLVAVTLTLAGAVAMRVVVALLLGGGVRGEDGLDSRAGRQGEAEGDQARQECTPVAVL